MKYLYLVELYRGRANKNYRAFIHNANTYYAKAGDYAGINNHCLLIHSQDERTVHSLMSEEFEGDGTDLTVTEITSATLADRTSGHSLYISTIEYFQRYHKLSNL